jgi:hypothetical protein
MFFGLSGEARQLQANLLENPTLLGIKLPASKPQNSVWCVCLSTLRGCGKVFTNFLPKGSRWPVLDRAIAENWAVTSHTVCATFDAMHSDASPNADEKPNSAQIQDRMELKVCDLGSQRQ